MVGDMGNYMRSSGSLTSRDFSGSTLRQISSLGAYLPRFPVQRSALPLNFLRTSRKRPYPKPLPESPSLQTLSTVRLGQFRNSLFSLRSKVRMNRHEQVSAKEVASCRNCAKTSNSQILAKRRNKGNLTQRTEHSQVSLQLASDGMQTEEDLLPQVGRERACLHARLFDWTSIPTRKRSRVRRISVLKLGP